MVPLGAVSHRFNFFKFVFRSSSDLLWIKIYQPTADHYPIRETSEVSDYPLGTTIPGIQIVPTTVLLRSYRYKSLATENDQPFNTLIENSFALRMFKPLPQFVVLIQAFWLKSSGPSRYRIRKLFLNCHITKDFERKKILTSTDSNAFSS